MKAPHRLPIFCSGTVAVLLKCRPSNSLEGVKSFFFPLLFSYSFSLLFRLSFVSSTSLHPPPVPFFFFLFPHLSPAFCPLCSLPPHGLFSSFPAWLPSLFISFPTPYSSSSVLHPYPVSTPVAILPRALLFLQILEFWCRGKALET